MVHKSDQRPEKDERLEHLKKQASSIENSFKTVKDPTSLFQQFGEYLLEIKSQPYGNSPHLVYFFEQLLPRVIPVLLKRNDLDEFTSAVKRFFSLIMECIVYTFTQDRTPVEGMEILNKLFSSGCPLYKSCHLADEEDEIEYSQTTLVFCKETEWSLIGHHVEYFGKLGGYEKILHFITHAEKVPLMFLRFYVHAITKVRLTMFEEFLEQYYKQLQSTMFTTISRFSDEDFKNEANSRREITDICNSFQILLHTIQPKGSSEAIERFFLDTVLKCFRSPFLEKRLTGLNDIKDVISIVSRSVNKQDNNQNSNMIELYWVNPEFFVKWIKENKILEQLYGENLHGELVKRSIDIPRFLALMKELDRGYLDLMWDASKEKHETIVHIIYSIFGELFQHLPIEDLDYLFEEKIRKILYSSYDYQTLYLVRMISIPAINANLTSKKKKWYGLDIFWDLFQDSNHSLVASDVSNQALSFLFDFLHWGNCYSQRVPFMERCIENIKNHDSVPQTLTILSRIISTYPETISKKSDCVYSVIEWLENNHQMLNIVLQDLVHYKQCSKEQASKLPPSTDLDTAILYGTKDHFSQIKDRSTFLEYVLTHSGLMLSMDQLNVFWSCLVTNALTIAEKELAFGWLENTRGANLISPAFDDEMTQYIFVSKIGELDFSSLTVAGLSFFEFFFRYVNWKNHKFEQTENSYFITSLDLIGMDKLWSIALEARDPTVGKQAIALLNNMHKNLAEHLKPYIGQQREEYIKTCMNHLSEASKDYASNELKTHRCLNLLKTFLDEFEPKTGANHGAASKGAPLTLKMNFMGGNHFELEVFSNDLVKQLKAEVSKKINTPVTLFRLITAGRELTEDEVTLQAARITSGQTIVVMKRPSAKPQPESSSSQPSAQISDNEITPSKILSKQEYFNQLFDLLNLAPIAQQVWDLLMLLPTNQKLFQAMYALDGIEPSNPNWNFLLSTNSTFKLYYSLQIVDSFLEKRLESENLDTSKWRQNFLALNGLNHLFNILLTNDFQDPIKGSKRKPCLALILKIINSLLVDPNTTLFSQTLLSQSVPVQQLLEKLLEIVWFASIPGSESSMTPIQPFVQPESISPPTIDDIHVVDQSLILLSNILSFFPQMVPLIPKHARFSQWLWDIILCSPERVIRENVVDTLYKLSNTIESNSEILLHSFFLDLLLQFLSKLSNSLISCEQYFSFLCKLVADACKGKGGKSSSDFRDLLFQVVDMIKQHPIVETRDLVKEDTLLRGLLQLCLTIVKEDESFKLEVGSIHHKGLILHVFDKCLFDIPTKDNHGSNAPPSCKTLKSRKVAFSLLTELVKNCQENFMELSSYLLSHFLDSKKPGWSYLPSAFEKSSSGYVGLRNLGATCYMNSLMQQLYNIPQFRYGLFSTPIKPEEQESEKLKDNVLFQIQNLLSHLQESEKKYYDTQDFCKSYKYEGQPINPTIQMDADEFFNMLFDKLEYLSKDTPQNKLYKQFFGGEFANQIISKECTHISEKEENFFTVSLEVKNKKNILESLELFTHGDVLEGENKYFCGTCNKKVDALKRTCINSLPDVLILHAKRFEFDLETMRRTKVNDYCEFPHLLDMLPFTKEGLMLKENPQSEIQKRDPSYYQYQLSGILVHTGTADSGHYYSFIRDRSGPNEGKWFQFNDSEVEPFDSNEIAAQTFGGMETVPQWDATQQRHVSQVVPKIYSAYMLFYDRVTPVNLKKDQVLTGKEESKLVPRSIFDKIWEENMTFLREKNVFDVNYFQFVWDVVTTNVQLPPVLDYTLDTSDALRVSIEMATKFIFTILAYAKEKQSLRDYVDRLKQMYSNHIPACKWFIASLTNQKDFPWLKSILFQCPVSETREILSRLIVHVMSCLSPIEKHIYSQVTSDSMEIEGQKKEESMILVDLENPFGAAPKFVATSLNIRLIETLLQMLKEAPFFWRNFTQYFLIFREFASFGIEEKQYLISRNVTAQFIDFYLAEDSPYAKFTQKQKKPKMGDKLKMPNLSYMVDFIGSVVKNCSTFSSVPPPSQTPGPKLQLSKLDQEMVYCSVFYSKSLRENIAPKSLSAIVNHLCWENEAHSNLLIDVCTSGINSVDHDKFGPYFDVFTPLLSLQDSYHERRVDRALSSYLRVIQSNLKYKNATYYSVKYLFDTANLDFVKEWLFQNKEKWVEILLIEHPEEHIREITSKLIQALVPKYPALPEDRDFKILMDEDITEATLKRVNELYLFLLSLIPSLVNHIRVEVDQSKMLDDTGIWKLVQYFRLIRWFAKGAEDKLKFGDYYSHFYHLFESLDHLQYPCDENKCELMYFWDYMVTECPENLNLISEKSLNRIMDFFVSISSNLRFKQYNQYGLTPFYHIIYLLCLRDTKFLEKVMGHTNFEWAVKFMYIESQEYPAAAALLFKMLVLCCRYPDFRTKYIHNLLYSGRMEVTKIAHLDLFDNLLITLSDCITFCTNDGVQKLSQFLESRNERENEIETVLELGLKVFCKATSWMIDPINAESYANIKAKALQSWDSSSKLSLLTTIISLCKHYQENRNIFASSLNVIAILSVLDENCFSTSYQFISTSYASGFINQGNLPYFATLIERICEPSLFKSEPSRLQYIVHLSLEFAKGSINNTPLGLQAIKLLHKITKNASENDSMILLNHPNLKELVLNILTIYTFHLVQPEAEDFVKEIFTKLFDSLTLQDKEVIKANLTTNFQNSINFAQHNHQSEIFISNSIALLKSVEILSSKDAEFFQTIKLKIKELTENYPVLNSNSRIQTILKQFEQFQ